jgi:hypothetical protein
LVISDRYRAPIRAEKKADGAIFLRSPRSVLILSEGEFDRLVAFVREEARLQVYPMAPKSRPESPPTDE